MLRKHGLSLAFKSVRCSSAGWSASLTFASACFLNLRCLIMSFSISSWKVLEQEKMRHSSCSAEIWLRHNAGIECCLLSAQGQKREGKQNKKERAKQQQKKISLYGRLVHLGAVYLAWLIHLPESREQVCVSHTSSLATVRYKHRFPHTRIHKRGCASITIFTWQGIDMQMKTERHIASQLSRLRDARNPPTPLRI